MMYQEKSGSPGLRNCHFCVDVSISEDFQRIYTYHTFGFRRQRLMSQFQVSNCVSMLIGLGETESRKNPVLKKSLDTYVQSEFMFLYSEIKILFACYIANLCFFNSERKILKKLLDVYFSFLWCYWMYILDFYGVTIECPRYSAALSEM
jgi:hypothetical protein